jgi:glucose-1-phosphate thymidylyltransferase
VARPWEFGVAELEGERVVRLEEKPKQPRSDLALVGVYLFTRCIFDAVRAIKPSARGELEITDAIQHLISTGRNVRSHVIHGWWKDTGRVEDLLEANRIVLADLPTRNDATVDAQTVIEGPVQIGAGTVVARSRLRGPLVIGAGAHISDAYVGPFSAIADGVRIEQCEIENSIVLDNSHLHAITGRIESSLIGRDVVVTASEARPSAHRLMLGDSSRVELA